MRGRLEARFEPGASGVVARTSFASPLELRGPFPGAVLPTYYLRNISAGILDGDRYEASFHAEPGVRVLVAPTAATKVFASRHRGARLSVRLEALPGSVLGYSSGVTILHEDACLQQDVEIVLHAGASIAYIDVLALGRLAHGERLAFHRNASTLRVCRPGGVVMYEERFSLEPRREFNSLDASVDGAGVHGSALLLGDAGRCTPSIEDSPDLYAGASLLPNDAGAVVRVLGNRAEVVSHLLEEVASQAVLATE